MEGRLQSRAKLPTTSSPKLLHSVADKLSRSPSSALTYPNFHPGARRNRCSRTFVQKMTEAGGGALGRPRQRRGRPDRLAPRRTSSGTSRADKRIWTYSRLFPSSGVSSPSLYRYRLEYRKPKYRNSLQYRKIVLLRFFSGIRVGICSVFCFIFTNNTCYN